MEEELELQDCAKSGTFFKNTRCLEILFTFSQTLKSVMSFTNRVQCLSWFGFVRYESQAFICEPRAFIHSISCCKEK